MSARTSESGPLAQAGADPGDVISVSGHHTYRRGMVHKGAFRARHAESPIVPLYSEDQIAKAIVELRQMLKEDETPQRKSALEGKMADAIRSFEGRWFQRIDFPEHNLTSTSDRRCVSFDEGGFNTLGKRLTSEEASILRPWPKWHYIAPILPELRGKSVLEIGSSDGFFSFRFAERGAASVTGVEISGPQCARAVWSANVLGMKNVSFLNTDALFDLRIPKHDIVFLSEVDNHFLLPLLGLLRILNLARERVILDAGAVNTPDQAMYLDSCWDDRTGRLMYHNFTVTDGLRMDLLNHMGVPSSNVVRYQAPHDEYHILYSIDMTGVETWDITSHTITDAG